MKAELNFREIAVKLFNRLNKLNAHCVTEAGYVPRVLPNSKTRTTKRLQKTMDGLLTP